MAGRLTGGIFGFWRSALSAAGNRRHRLETAREVDALDPHERGRVLGEAGMSRRDFAGAISAPFASEDLLARGLCAIGIDPMIFDSRQDPWRRDMQRVCAGCPARSRCRRDLATDDFARRYRHYCPNAESLSEIAAGAVPEALVARPGGRG